MSTHRLLARQRQVPLDFHTSPHIPGVGADFDAMKFAARFKSAHVNGAAVFEVAAIVSMAVFRLINDVVPQELLGRFYGPFRAVSLHDGIIFNFWIMGLGPIHFTLILVVIGVLYGVAYMVGFRTGLDEERIAAFYRGARSSKPFGTLLELAAHHQRADSRPFL